MREIGRSGFRFPSTTWAWATCRSTRAAATLSGGEAQRIRLATQIGSSLVGVL